MLLSLFFFYCLSPSSSLQGIVQSSLLPALATFVTFHSTPLALWRGAGGEAFTLPSQGSWRGPGIGGEAFTFHFLGRLRLEIKFKIKT